ncbi:MAG: hypothetical protein DI535_12715 [Citrobacter freundii]|nr:MAG: hypothetical protein DI535_12715 [Citrobacter freundii]
MRKQLLTIAIMIISFSAFSQKGSNRLGLGADVAIPTGEFSDLSGVGFGGYLKGLYGVGKSGQVTVTYSYTVFKVKEDLQNLFGVDKLNVRIMPFMLGYRQNINGFYLEPQAGYGVYSARATVGNQSATETDGAFAWAVGAGYALNKGFDLGVSYQNLSKEGDSNSWISIRLGYNFSFGK